MLLSWPRGTARGGGGAARLDEPRPVPDHRGGEVRRHGALHLHPGLGAALRPQVQHPPRRVDHFVDEGEGLPHEVEAAVLEGACD